jgi:multidrug efflux pump subunit AcrA (membrane-fusion protein)
MKKYTLPFLASASLVFAVVSVVTSRPARTAAQPPEPPAQAAFDQTVGAVGLVEAATENIAISTPVPGLVTAVYVQAGDRVAADQKLFSLDDRDLQAELEVRRQALEVARTRLERLERLPRPEEIPAAEARLQQAETALADTQVQLRLIESVTDRRAIREEDLERRRLAVEAARGRRDEARAQLDLLKAGSWGPEIEVARTEVVLAEQQVRRVQTDIERLTVRAPIAGEILQLNLRAGEYAASGPLPKPLLLMGSVGRLHVRADVDEHDAGRVRAGAPAVASPRGNARLRLPLQFVRFEPYVVPKKSLTGDSTERVDTRVLQVIYAFDRGQAPVYVGQQMDVFIKGVSQ